MPRASRRPRRRRSPGRGLRPGQPRRASPRGVAVALRRPPTGTRRTRRPPEPAPRAGAGDDAATRGDPDDGGRGSAAPCAGSGVLMAGQACHDVLDATSPEGEPACAEEGVYLETSPWTRATPAGFGRFWEALLGGSTLTDEPDLFETRLTVPRGAGARPLLPERAEPVVPSPRLHLDLSGGPRQDEVVQRALDLGARHLDIGQGEVPWSCWPTPRATRSASWRSAPSTPRTSGPIAAVPVDSADPARDAAFWAELSGWEPVTSDMPAALRRASAALLELCPSRDPPSTRAPRTGCTSTSGSRRATSRMPSWPGSSSSVVASSTPGGVSCRGGWSPTPRATTLPAALPHVLIAGDPRPLRHGRRTRSCVVPFVHDAPCSGAPGPIRCSAMNRSTAAASKLSCCRCTSHAVATTGHRCSGRGERIR